MTLRKLMFNERVDARELYEKGFEGEFTYRKVRLVCIYMRLELGYGADRIKTEIIKFCKKEDPYFNPIVKDTRKRLGEIINSAMKVADYKRTECPVIIRQSELNTIRKIKNFKYQKLLLAILFVVKSRHYNRVLDETLFPYIREMLTVREGLNNYQLLVLVHDFIESGFLKELTQHSWIIAFMNDDTSPVFTVLDDQHARNLISMYVKLCGGEIGYCKVCDDEFVKSGVRDLYCDTHKKEVSNKQKLEYKRRRNLV